MTNEIEPTCCCGCIGLRNGTRIIATCYLILGVILTAITIYSLIVVIPNLFEKIRSSTDPTISVSYLALELSISMNILTSVFVESVYIYLNLCLRKATFERNIEYIRFWLVINGLGMIYYWISIGFMSIIIAQSIAMVIIKIVISGIIVYFQIVVYRFYQKELAAKANVENFLYNNMNRQQLMSAMPVSVSKP